MQKKNLWRYRLNARDKKPNIKSIVLWKTFLSTSLFWMLSIDRGLHLNKHKYQVLISKYVSLPTVAFSNCIYLSTFWQNMGWGGNCPPLPPLYWRPCICTKMKVRKKFPLIIKSITVWLRSDCFTVLEYLCTFKK